MKLFEMFKKEEKRTCPIEMPSRYQLLKPLPSDPEDMSIFAVQTSGCIAVVNVRPIGSDERHMPFGDPGCVIADIHADHDDDQGLIEVNAFATRLGYRGIYSIVKTVLIANDERAEGDKGAARDKADERAPGGVQYGLLVHMDTANGPVSVHGFFEEFGITGVRECVIAASMTQTGKVGPGLEGWMRDPYDPEHTRGIPMNLSEHRKFDAAFPEHPLSISRELVAYLRETN